MNTPSTNPPRRRRRAGLALLTTATVAALLLATYLGAGTSRPGTSPGRSAGTSGGTAPAGGPLPISTGGVVQPSTLPGQTPAPGQSPTIAADTVPLTRPMFEFTGSRPWQIQALPSPSTALEGYASRPSYLPGDTLRLAVSTTAPTYDLTIWRVSGAAPVDSPFVRVASAGNLPGRIQPAPTVDPTTRMVAARWPLTYSFPIPSWWQSGVYLVRLDSSEHVQSYIPFVLRSPSAHAVLVVSNALTWQAYNDWGGSSVYQTSVGEPAPGLRRALGVSFDRPYTNEDGAGQLFTYELPLISWLERQGLDLSFTTDYDLSLAPDSAPLPRVVVFNGHIHNYERFFRDGTVYLVSGGGGAAPVPVARGENDLYKGTEYPNYHYLKFVLRGKRLNSEMIRLADPSADKPKWEVKDRFQISGPK